MKISWHRVLWLVVVFDIIYQNPARCEQKRKLEKLEAPQVTLTVSTRVCLAPCEVDIRVHIVRHSGNRYLWIGWSWNGDSLISLDGENSEPAFERKATLREDGEHTIHAVLYRKVTKNGKDEVAEYHAQANVSVGGGP